ncbi:DUF3304 domain-containing protein [Evtepia sp.]|uniref:DUF3304 domain-containing protein n=1 Tax=Evtepia sp. TaxID=2773933 RepID=UPI00387ECA24
MLLRRRRNCAAIAKSRWSRPYTNGKRCSARMPAEWRGGIHIPKRWSEKPTTRLQKCFTVDFLTKKKKVNEGEVPQYYVEHSHEPIITPEEFDKVRPNGNGANESAASTVEKAFSPLVSSAATVAPSSTPRCGTPPVNTEG